MFQVLENTFLKMENYKAVFRDPREVTSGVLKLYSQKIFGRIFSNFVILRFKPKNLKISYQTFSENPALKKTPKLLGVS